MPNMPNSHHPGLVVLDHPLIQHKLSHLRDASLGHGPFRALLAQIAGLMVYEATRDLPTQSVSVRTPLEETLCHRLASGITVVPVLRSGLGMAEGILQLLPEARVGHLGLARDEQTKQPSVYLERLPSDVHAGTVLLVDPMLATGGSASAATTLLKDARATHLRLLCLVAAPEGVARMRRDHPDVTIYTAALDRCLNEHAFICPGLGDAGDRMYGTQA